MPSLPKLLLSRHECKKLERCYWQYSRRHAAGILMEKSRPLLDRQRKVEYKHLKKLDKSHKTALVAFL